MEFVPGQVAFGGRYRVESILHVGPRSIVVAAALVAHESQRVAIKVARPALARDPVAMARFLSAAQVGAMLRGNHTVRTLDVGRSEDGAYLVMELIEGKGLAVTLASGALIETPRLVDLLLQICEALAEMHALGIVHRDIEPGNLIVSRRDGRPWVTVVDFFFARSFDKTTRLTRTGGIIGKPPYASPEQLRLDPLLDGRSDIWSAGAVACVAATGQPPFQAPSFAELIADIHAGGQPQLPESMPASLAAIIARCLQRDPAARYQTAAELAAALAPLSADPAARECRRRSMCGDGGSRQNVDVARPRCDRPNP